MFPKQLPSLGRCSFVSQYQPSRSLITTTQLTRTAVLDCVNTPAAPSASTVNNSIDIRRKEGEHDEVNMMMAGKVEVESSARLFNNNFEEEGNDINIDNDHHHIASSSPFVAVRSSPQAKFGKARIGMTTFPAELSSVIASIAKDHNKNLLKDAIDTILHAQWSTGAGNKHSMWVDDPENVGVKVKVPQVQPKAISYTSTSSTGGSGGSRTPSSLESTSSEMTCTAYTTVKTQNSYAALTTVLSHLSRRCPDFIPRNILDFGCGPGSAIWAACDIWPSQVQTAHLVDLAEPFLHIAQRFAKARMQSNDKEIASRVPQKQITYQRFLSQKSMSEPIDLAIAAFVLQDMTTDSVRRKTIEKLWNSTSDMLVIIERGTPPGFKVVAEARKYILEDIVGKSQGAHDAHIVAPCPHDGACPMLNAKSSWCHFSQRLQRDPNQMKWKKCKSNLEDVSFSYIVVRKGKRPEKPTISTSALATISPLPIDSSSEVTNTSGVEVVKEEGEASSSDDFTTQAYGWRRLVAPPIKNKGHIILDSCTSEGNLERITVTKSKQGSQGYRDARKAHWHDLWPHEPIAKVAQRRW